MSYPDRLKLSYLESEHADYQEVKPLYAQLEQLTQGGHLLEQNKAFYLPKRPGENNDIFQARLNKFTYTNILGAAISSQTTKLSSGAYSISGLESDFWETFRESVDGCDLTENELLKHVFRESLIYKKLFVQIDKPIPVAPPRNKLEEEQLGLRPYLTLYSAREVIDWVESKGRLQMIKVKQFSTYRPTLLSPPVDQVTFTLITDEVVLKYSALVKLKNGKVIALLNAQGNELATVDEETAIALEIPPIVHRFGEIPVLKFELPDELWACNQVYLKAKEHLVLDNTRFDAASMAYVQRVLTPQITAESDLSQTYIEEETILSGNPYILKAANFQFAEMNGAVLNTLTAILADLETQVKDTLALGGMSADIQAMQQSGVSKKMNFVEQELVLRAYGALLLSFYQDVLQGVAHAAGFSESIIQSISATGYSSFSLDSIDDLLLQALSLQNVQSFLTESTFRLFCKQLNTALVPNASSLELAEINQEVNLLSLPTGQGVKPDSSTDEQNNQTPNLGQEND